MHFKSFVLASFAASIATAIPIPQLCPFNWKRSAQRGCEPQTAPLPSLLPYLSDPSSVPNPTSQEYYSPDPFGNTSPNTPAANAVTDTRPPPMPLSEYAPWSIPAAAAGAAAGLWKLRHGFPDRGVEGGNWGRKWGEALGESKLAWCCLWESKIVVWVSVRESILYNGQGWGCPWLSYGGIDHFSRLTAGVGGGKLDKRRVFAVGTTLRKRSGLVVRWAVSFEHSKRSFFSSFPFKDVFTPVMYKYTTWNYVGTWQTSLCDQYIWYVDSDQHHEISQTDRHVSNFSPVDKTPGRLGSGNSQYFVPRNQVFQESFCCARAIPGWKVSAF